MKTLFVIIAVMLISGAWYLGANTGNSMNTTQTYSASRYALLEADVNIANVMNSGGLSNNVQKTVLKLDTLTGNVWVLQLAVNGTGDPTVRSAVWTQVQNSGTFYPNGQPLD